MRKKPQVARGISFYKRLDYYVSQIIKCGQAIVYDADGMEVILRSTEEVFEFLECTERRINQRGTLEE